MKSISNTLIAALMAVGLAVFVAIIPLIPIFGTLEDHTTDELMKLRYNLHEKYAPLPPDPHLVFVPIDEVSVQELGRWPFSRNIHGQLLQVLAPEKPKVVTWDILFTETSTPTSAIPANPAAGSQPAPAPPPVHGNAPPHRTNRRPSFRVRRRASSPCHYRRQDGGHRASILKEGFVADRSR